MKSLRIPTAIRRSLSTAGQRLGRYRNSLALIIIAASLFASGAVLAERHAITTTVTTTETQTPPTTASVAKVNISAPQGSLININTATAPELESLPRIGPVTAQKIIDYRTAHGPFASIEHIQDVSGIGPATFAQIYKQISVQ